ncbi:arylamine N-acetyltransferase [Labrenzia sp. R5_0]|jgi:N-hydroxyarylamine O-acetyltransferase|uniref:arylamine N-acetyltransferase family protein n=1 Tax=Labrenzia sp. R5_0 TaxID=2821108 RepID=UPI001ADC077C|nr:arylamine N-acetyltransferase [Labrenzia sp. R5_0]MBO9459691.1 arylamine N-acetyltransferase [Labrenzia sp. R5_0]
MPFDLNFYLERIGLETCPATLEGLRALQAAQISAIPFENVLPFLGKVPELGRDSLWQKLVQHRCGGYCFELNSLLGDALAAIGFSSRQVLARVRMGAAEGGARSHLAHVVTCDGTEWLVDAGFGGQAPAEPVRISEERQQARDQVYRIRLEAASGEHVLERQTEEGWFALYGFDRVDVRPVDIEAANFLCAASPRQSFAGSMKFYRLTDRGFISFLDGRARFVGGGNKREWLIEEAEDLGRFMRNDLGLGYDDDTVRAIALRLQDLRRLD